MRKIRIGTRGSRLALAQVDEIVGKLEVKNYKVITLNTQGDIDKATPLDQAEGTDFFTDQIDKALLKGEIDLAVHAAKDLPHKIAEGLTIAAITKSADSSDVLVSKDNLKVDELPGGARVGTSSQRRKKQLKDIRPDLDIVDLRGNIEERLEKLDRGEYEAIVIAAAGLIRLGLEKRICQRMPFETAKGQGSLALEIREDDKELENWLKQKFI